jgi:hypothetical protein
MRTIQEERTISARGADPKTAARTVRHALAAWEADSGPTRITSITRLALIWPYAGVIAGIAPLESSAIEGIVAAGVHVLATVRDQPPYTHVIGAPGGQDYLATLETVWTNPRNAPPVPRPA